MLKEILLKVAYDNRKELVKLGVGFVGGVVVGVAIGSQLNSGVINDIKEEASDAVNEFVKPKKEISDKESVVIEVTDE